MKGEYLGAASPCFLAINFRSLKLSLRRQAWYLHQIHFTGNLCGVISRLGQPANEVKFR